MPVITTPQPQLKGGIRYYTPDPDEEFKEGPAYLLKDIVFNDIFHTKMSNKGNLSLLMSRVIEDDGSQRRLFFCDKEEALALAKWIQETYKEAI